MSTVFQHPLLVTSLRHCHKQPSTPSSNKESPSTSLETVTDSSIHNPDSLVGRLGRFSQESLRADGREKIVEAVIFQEETSSYPILARGKRNIYDHTDDIPMDVRPMHEHHYHQQRFYFKFRRELAERPLWRRAATWIFFTVGSLTFMGLVAFTRIWLMQPQEIAELRSQLLSKSYGYVVELAAGQGLNVGSFPYPVHTIVMVDSDAAQLDRLRYRLPVTAYPKYEVVADRVEKLDKLADGEFDCVVDMFGLCHYRDPLMALRQMQRVVKPTGTILLLEHGRSRYWLVNVILNLLMERHRRVTSGCQWNLDIEQLLRDARLDIRELENWHYGTTYYIVAHPEVLDEPTLMDPPVQTAV